MSINLMAVSALPQNETSVSAKTARIRRWKMQENDLQK